MSKKIKNYFREAKEARIKKELEVIHGIEQEVKKIWSPRRISNYLEELDKVELNTEEREAVELCKRVNKCREEEKDNHVNKTRVYG